MDKDFLIHLTNNIYKLTLLFPKKEPLRYKMRELATDILSKKTEKDLQVLDSFFEVAKSQNWVSPTDILVVQEEYANLREQLIVEVKPQQLISQMGNRQEKILEFLKKYGKTQVWQVQQIFPELTKRTLRRDFEQMLNQGLIERIGDRNETFYQIKG